MTNKQFPKDFIFGTALASYQVEGGIYNNDWSDLTSPMQESLKQISTSNVMGEVIKVLMISSSGAEGINLKNVRRIEVPECGHLIPVEDPELFSYHLNGFIKSIK